MNAAVMLLGLTLGQMPEPEYFPFSSADVKLPIQYKKDRTAIREILLFVSRDQGATWELTANMPPNQDSFTYHFPEEGLYWFTMVDVNLKGERNPADLTKVPPDQKFLFDKTPPTLKITDARRLGDDVVLHWSIEDKHADDAATKLSFRSASAPESGPWSTVKLSEKTRNGVKFNPGMPGAVVVKLHAQDLVGLKVEAVREVPAVGAITQTSTNPPTLPQTSLKPSTTDFTPPALPSDALKPTLVAPIGPDPVAPVGTMPAMPSAPAVNLDPPAPISSTPTFAPPAAPSTVPTPALSTQSLSPSVAPAMTPIATGQGLMVPAQPPTVSSTTMETTKPIASSLAPPPAPTVLPTPGIASSTPSQFDPMRVQVMNTLRFDLAYEVEQKGPSGISRVDLWVTRDEGRTWQRWSQHDGRETPIRVALDLRENRQIEGPYGFRLVPVSGAGLSENAPAAGEAPDLRVVVDVTPPAIELYQPYSDPHAVDTLIIPWRASDKNFGDEPIAIEWSEHATGPWKPIEGPAAVVPVSNVVGAAPRRLPNNGRYSWRVPSTLPTHKVFLRVTAKDQAGNQSEVLTPSPILVDLAKPKAKIQGIVTVAPVARP